MTLWKSVNYHACHNYLYSCMLLNLRECKLCMHHTTLVKIVITNSWSQRKMKIKFYMMVRLNNIIWVIMRGYYIYTSWIPNWLTEIILYWLFCTSWYALKCAEYIIRWPRRTLPRRPKPLWAARKPPLAAKGPPIGCGWPPRLSRARQFVWKIIL